MSGRPGAPELLFLHSCPPDCRFLLTMPITQDEFRSALSRFASGVTVVTTKDAAGNIYGITVSAFCSVSLDPPLVLICIEKATGSHFAFQESGVFNVNILSKDQADLSERFASQIPDKFDCAEISLNIDGVPLLTGCLGSPGMPSQANLRRRRPFHLYRGRGKDYDQRWRPAVVFHRRLPRDRWAGKREVTGVPSQFREEHRSRRSRSGSLRSDKGSDRACRRIRPSRFVAPRPSGFRRTPRRTLAPKSRSSLSNGLRRSDVSAKRFANNDLRCACRTLFHCTLRRSLRPLAPEAVGRVVRNNLRLDLCSRRVIRDRRARDMAAGQRFDIQPGDSHLPCLRPDLGAEAP